MVEDKRIIRTRHIIEQTLLGMLYVMPLDKVSVTELCSVRTSTAEPSIATMRAGTTLPKSSPSVCSMSSTQTSTCASSASSREPTAGRS